MVFKITAVKTIDDPQERRRRLAQLYSIFEKDTAAASSVSEAKAIKLQRENNNTSLKKRQSEVST